MLLTVDKNSPIIALFHQSQKNSYLLRAFKFDYNDFDYILLLLFYYFPDTKSIVQTHTLCTTQLDKNRQK